MASPVQIRFAVMGLQDVTRGFDTVERALVRMERSGSEASRRGSTERVATAKQERATKERELSAYAAFLTREENAGVRAAETAAAKRERVAESSYRRLERELDASKRRELAIVERHAAAEARAVEAAHKKVASVYGGAATKTFSSMGSLAGLGAAAFGMGGSFLMADAVRGSFSAEASAAQLVNAVTTTGKPPPGASVASIMARAEAASNDTGMDRGEVIKGALAYSRSAKGGDFEGAMGTMPFLARMSKVTGTDISTLGQAAGTLQSQNANLKPAEMEQMLLDVYSQGKAGSMSMVDVASQMGKLSSTRNMYVGDTATTQRKLFALGQLAAPEGSKEEAATYVSDFSAEAMKHQKELAAMGVKFKGGKIADVDQAISATLQGTNGDMGKLEKLFGIRGMRVPGALVGAYDAAGGGEKGAAAAVASFEKVAGATMTPGDLEAQLAQTMSNSGERFAQAVEKIRNALEDDMAPVVEKIANELPELIDPIERVISAGGRLAQWFLDNPFTGIGSIMAIKFGEEIAMAKFPKLLEGMVATANTGSGFTGALGKLGAAAGIAAAAWAAIQLGKALIDAAAADDDKERGKNAEGSTDAHGKAIQDVKDAKKGKLTPARLAQIAAEDKRLEDQKHKLEGGPGVVGTTLDFVTGSGADSAASRTSQIAQLDATLKLHAEALRLNTEATRANTDVSKPGRPVATPGAPGSNTNDPARHSDMTHPGR